MKQRLLLLSWLGALLFLSGVFVGLALSGAVAWAGSESYVYSSFNGDVGLAMKCPLMMSPRESGTVTAKITNLTHEDIQPVVSAEISHGKLPRETKQTVLLVPKQSKTLEWIVDSSDVIFGRLILVNVLQSRYRDNPSRLGSCGIVLFTLFNLTGVQSFALVIALSLVLILSGGWLWLYKRRPLDQFSENVVRINSVLLGITILAILSTIAGRWGWGLFFDALILLVLGVIFTEFVLFSQRYRE